MFKVLPVQYSYLVYIDSCENVPHHGKTNFFFGFLLPPTIFLEARPAFYLVYIDICTYDNELEIKGEYQLHAFLCVLKHPETKMKLSLASTKHII